MEASLVGDLGRIGIIANPAAQSGAAASVAGRFHEMMLDESDASSCKLLLTEHPGHAIEIAEKVHHEYDTIVVIGGDGIVHEAVNGLMRVPKEARPRLAVVPVGSGNDYALTLGMSMKPEHALAQILKCDARAMDIGCVNGEFFAETLSFGLDAAIALDTVERRKKTGRHGTMLYMESGFDQIFHHLVPQDYECQLGGVPGAADGTLHIDGQSYIFAVQIGRTYGGHFDICPNADPQDGLFDICIAHPPLSPLKAAFVFMMAKGGHHTKMKPFEFHRASALDIEFNVAPAAQADGEKVEGSTFHVETLAGALDVIVGDYRE